MTQSRKISESRAPGKLMLSGEYAVLLGAESLVAAVDRYVTVIVENGTPGYTLRGASGDVTLPSAALKACGEPELLDKLVVDVSQLYTSSGQKLGLGSSAASIVAICRAAGIDETKLLEAAMKAHHALQGGAGSGADVAASALGGVLRYQCPANMGGWAPLVDVTQVQATAITLPRDVRIEAIWLGAPASSTSLIRQVIASGEAAVRPVLRALQAASDVMIRACLAKERSRAKFLEGVDMADEAMEALGRVSGAPIVIEQHRTLRGRARRFGLVCKTSGAGGGDFSLVAGPTSADWAGFLERQNGHIPLRLGA